MSQTKEMKELLTMSAELTERRKDMMSRLSSVVSQHPLITFFVLAYTLAWALESPLVFLGDTVTGTQSLVLKILASNVPSVVAIVLTAIVLGRGSLRKLLGRLLIWRVNPLWHLVVFLGPVALTGGAVGLSALMGGPALSLGMPLLGVAIFLAFSIFPGSALGEEIGWRGTPCPVYKPEGAL
jgi:membrane protease YdiL (CAAX protease family)